MLSYKVREKISMIRCTANQAGTGHKLHFQPKHPARAKLAAINNKNGCDTAEVWFRKFKSVSYHLYYHIWSGKRHICSVVLPTKSAETISSIFSPKIQLGPHWQQWTTKSGCDTAEVCCRQFGSISYHWNHHIRSVKSHIYSVVPTTNSAQAISSIFSPKVQLGPN